MFVLFLCGVQVKFDGLTGPVAFEGGVRSDYRIDVYSLHFKHKMAKVWEGYDLSGVKTKSCVFIPE